MKVSWQKYALFAAALGVAIWGLESVFDLVSGHHSMFPNFGFGWWAAGGAWASRFWYTS